MPYHVMGLDLSKTTGVAIGCDVGPWFWSRIELNPSGALQGIHFFNFQKRLGEELLKWKPDLVVFEEVEYPMRLKGGQLAVYAYRTNAILCGLVMTRCESLGVRYAAVGVSDLKRFAGAGVPRSKKPTAKLTAKEQMKAFAAQKLFGSVIPDAMPRDISDDEIDAIWAVQYGLTELARPRARRSA